MLRHLARRSFEPVGRGMHGDACFDLQIPTTFLDSNECCFVSVILKPYAYSRFRGSVVRLVSWDVFPHLSAYVAAC